MGSETNEFDPSQFLDFARSQMGNTEGGGLAGEFYSQCNQLYPNFWQVGCAFDSILDYFLTLSKAGQLCAEDTELANKLVSAAQNGYELGIVGMEANWYDDWCWWGIATAKAFDPDYADIFGPELIGYFQSAALDLWGLVDAGDFATVAASISTAAWSEANWTPSSAGFPSQQFTAALLGERSELHQGTRNAWALIERGATPLGTARQKADYISFTTETENSWAEPRFTGGCWQYDMSTMPFPPGDGPDWEKPWPSTTTPLGVYQVTLMSGLYLSFVCSLMAAAQAKAETGGSGGAWDRLLAFEDYKQKADEVVGFLTNWVEVPGVYSLACTGFSDKTPFAKGALVHERTPTYAAIPDGTYFELECYFPDAFWAGDQGLIMGSLKQYAEVTGETLAPDVATLPMQLLLGVFYNMPATNLKQGTDLPGAVGPVLDPAQSSPISGDIGDYGSGSGIFWRYVMRCASIDPAFAVTARADPKVAAMAQKSGTNCNGWGDALFLPFNTVAAAIGAWHLMTATPPAEEAVPGR